MAKQSQWAITALFILLLTACAGSQSRRANDIADTTLIPRYSGLQAVEIDIPEEKIESIPRQLAKQGVQALSAGELIEANTFFNQALMFDPSDSYLQWLNGIAYHLRVIQGESSQIQMAEEAYRLSIDFDPSNWMAHYQLGLLYMDNRDFAGVQDAFAEALFFRPGDPDLLYQMLCTSYYNHDPQTAAAALGQLQKIEPDSDRTLRSAPVIMAALGEQSFAEAEMLRYEVQNPDQAQALSLNQRVQDWNGFYASMEPASLTVAAATAKSASNQHQPPIPEPSSSFAADLDSQMVIVDVAIIQSEVDLGTRKGVNLLNGLRIQYGLDRISTDRRTSSDSSDGSSITDTFTRTLTKAISIPQLNYSLNIFNSASFTNEVLARPTLVALNGQQSRFFAGSNVRAAATASSTVGAASGGQAVEINEDIGVDLRVTPTLREDGKVRIDVEVTRTFLESPDESIDFEFKIQTSKTHVQASVVMAFGETLILSGLSEKESETFRDGVPILQDIPIIQYFFSEERTLDFQKSALVMITPRKPFTLNSLQEADSSPGGLAKSGSMRGLQKRFDRWFKPAPHWVSVIQHLEDSGLYREFRTGDLTLETWEDSEAFRRRFGDVVEFLYF